MLLLLLGLACRAVPPKEDTSTDGVIDTSGLDTDADGFSAEEGDCDESDAQRFPGAPEACDGIDNDCDGTIDDGVRTTWYADADGDGFGDPQDGVDACEGVDGRIPDASDCDDADPDLHPGAIEACDGLDNDCDGAVDEEGARTWYVDADADGYGDDASAVLDCADAVAGYVLVGGDCDDATAQVYPARPESCDELDNDCNGEVDEGVQTLYYADLDGDGWGQDALVQGACTTPTGYSPDGGDCDDGDTLYHPGAAETCTDPRDLNCDGSVGYADVDADGVAACNDCDDARADVRPGAVEVCNDTDDDCDGLVDDADAGLDVASAADWHADADADGFGTSGVAARSCDAPAGTVADASDCDDASAAVRPTAVEVCNGLDDDCDGSTDDADADLDTATARTWHGDADLDGFGSAGTSALQCDPPAGWVLDASDCDDSRDVVYPGAAEVCDGLDDDCDGLADDADPDLVLGTAGTWFPDVDADGHGDPGGAVLTCDVPSGYVDVGDDCDDVDPDVNPDATEVCNALDDDCDGSVDDADTSRDASTASTWYADTDGDGFGDPSARTTACVAPAGYLAAAGDCDDARAAVRPSATETCNGYDDDCDGLVDDSDPGRAGGSTWYRDADGDGYGVSSTTTSCTAPAGYAASAGDCNDGASGVSPGAAEVCANAADEDCDGSYSEGCPARSVDCGGPEAMDVGQTFSCSLPTRALVDTIRISVGCNDGESATYIVGFDDGSTASVTGTCGSTHSIAPRLASSMSLTMTSGGGPDNHISFGCCGSSGWGAEYR